MKQYRIGLRVGGLMEDPMWRHEMINIIEAESLNDAIDIWADITGENKKETWNKDYRSVWGWEVVDVDDDMAYINKHNDHVRSNM